MTNNYKLPPRIIGLAGQKRHGKNFLAANIHLYDPGFRITHFADKLKEITADVFGHPVDDFYDEAKKDAAFPEPVEMDKLIANMAYWTNLAIEPRGEIANSPRELLQLFGTEYVRSLDNDYWVNATMKNIRDTGHDHIVADVRFENEANAIRKAGGLVVRIIRDGRIDEAEHASERLDFQPDVVFHVATGDFNRMRDAAIAAVHMVGGARSFASLYDRVNLIRLDTLESIARPNGR